MFQGLTPVRTTAASVLHGIGDILSPGTGVAGELPPTTPTIAPPVGHTFPFNLKPPTSLGMPKGPFGGNWWPEPKSPILGGAGAGYEPPRKDQ